MRINRKMTKPNVIGLEWSLSGAGGTAVTAFRIRELVLRKHHDFYSSIFIHCMINVESHNVIPIHPDSLY